MRRTHVQVEAMGSLHKNSVEFSIITTQLKLRSFTSEQTAILLVLSLVDIAFPLNQITRYREPLRT